MCCRHGRAYARAAYAPCRLFPLAHTISLPSLRLLPQGKDRQKVREAGMDKNRREAAYRCREVSAEFSARLCKEF